MKEAVFSCGKFCSDKLTDKLAINYCIGTITDCLVLKVVVFAYFIGINVVVQLLKDLNSLL
jgi:hypothetical protein